MNIQYKLDRDPSERKFSTRDERNEYMRKLAVRYFMLQYKMNNITGELRKNSKKIEKKLPEMFNCQKEIEETELELNKSLETRGDYYAMTESIEKEYIEIGSKERKSEIIKHIICSTILFQLIFNGILCYFNDVSPKALLYSAGAALFSLIAGIISFRKAIESNETYKWLYRAYEDTLRTIKDIKERKFRGKFYS